MKVVWRKWARVGSKSGETYPNDLTSEVEFRIENNKLVRRETLTAGKDLTIKKQRVAVPTTADRQRFEIINGQRTDFLTGREGTLAATVRTDWKTSSDILAMGDSRLGKGVLGAIPFI